MSTMTIDYSGIVPLLPPMDTANIGALHEACWAYRARVLEHAK
jgi:hypothetical protein